MERERRDELSGDYWMLVLGAGCVSFALVEWRPAFRELSSPARLPICPSAPSAQPVRSLFFPAAVIAIVAQFAVLWAVIAGRAPASSPGRPARLAEIVWVVLPTVVLLLVIWLTWTRMGEPLVVGPVNGVIA